MTRAVLVEWVEGKGPDKVFVPWATRSRTPKSEACQRPIELGQVPRPRSMTSTIFERPGDSRACGTFEGMRTTVPEGART